VQAARKVVKGPEEGGFGDEEEDVDDGDSDNDSVSSYTDRWVPGSGMPGSFCLVVGPFGPLAPVVSVKGDLVRPLFLPGLSPDPGTFQFR
jgi:hypothetical protein